MTSQAGDTPNKERGEKPKPKRRGVRTSFRVGDGRPRGPKFDVKAGQEVIVAMRLGMTISDAAAAAGIDRKTYTNWKRRSRKSDAAPALKQWGKEMRSALQFSKRFYLGKVAEAAKGGTWQAAAWMLERRFPAEYGRFDRLEHSGGVDGAPAKIVLHLPGNGRDVDADGSVVDPTADPLHAKAPSAEGETPPAPPADGSSS
jgi:transposase